MKKIIRPIILLCIYVLLLVFSGCGSAEAIKGYHYQTKKRNLERAVMKVIKANPHIYLDSSEPKVIVRKHPNNDYSDTTKDTINASDYHDAHGVDSIDFFSSLYAYVKIKIKVGEVDNDYVFRYKGDWRNWDSSLTSEIFISSVHDKYGNGLEQGHNEKGQFRSKMAKEFTDLFEAEVVDKLDKELNL